MNTPIISISEDQNTITHESGVVTVFYEYTEDCNGCCYFEKTPLWYCSEHKLPCLDRIDKSNGIFKLKQ